MRDLQMPASGGGALMDKMIRGKCAHATAIVIHEYPKIKLVHMLCTWHCRQPYWMRSDGIVGREISENEAVKLLEVKNG
jgi:hypothetical protein